MKSKSEMEKRKIRIDLIGAGGNGSWLLPLLTRLAEHIPLEISVIDFDTIEEKNTKNQNLPFIHKGKPKAEVLTSHYNNICRPIFPLKFEVKKYTPRPTDIVISAVDNNESRLEVEKAGLWTHWLDCGVDQGVAYAALNTKTEKPSMDIFIQKEKAVGGLNCTMFLSPSQNIIAAGMAFLLLEELLRTGRNLTPWISYARNYGISNIMHVQNTDKICSVVFGPGDPRDRRMQVFLCIDHPAITWLYRWILAELSVFDHQISIIRNLEHPFLHTKRMYPGIGKYLDLEYVFGVSNVITTRGYTGNYDTRNAPVIGVGKSFIENINKGNGQQGRMIALTNKGAYLTEKDDRTKPIVLDKLTNKVPKMDSKVMKAEEAPTSFAENIRAALSAYVIYLQYIEGLVNYQYLKWEKENQCYTHKMEI